MEQRIKDRFNNDILEEIMKVYGIMADEIKVLDSFESFIYEFINDSGEYVLRISHSIRRNENLIQGEVEWINFLADNGISVARAISSQNGKLVEAIPDQMNGNFLATAFTKAKGSSPWGRWTTDLYERYGELIGSMHAKTNLFMPSQPDKKRPEWDDPIFDYVTSFLSENEFIIREKYQFICDHVNTIPKNNETYGLIHQDAHGGNLFIDENGQITLFDFDDCLYSWFINEIAIILFYIVMGNSDIGKFTKEFMIHFLQGYLKHCSLNLDLLKEIPYFLKMREIELFAVIQRDFGTSYIEDEWCNRYMQGRKYKIENDVPYIGFDFESLKLSL